MITLHEADGHRNVMFHEFSTGEMVQANQHLIVHNGRGMLLDPGGHKVYTKLFAELAGVVNPNGLEYILFSHQDPDIVAAANGWLMVTDAAALAPSLWMRFIPHFGIDELVIKRMTPVPDEGMTIELAGCPLKLLPAHFLHSAGNLHVYDTVSKILYSGDLGASMEAPSMIVEDFDAHIPFMEGFHKRYMASNRAMRAWAKMARTLDIETIAPQHGAIFKGRAMAARFIDWVETVECGVDLIADGYSVPA
jgi:flavorubredoxin